MKKNVGKNCKVCSTLLTEENCSSNVTAHCKPCYNAKMRTYFQKYKDKHRKLMYDWRKRNKDKVKQMLTNYDIKRFGSEAESSRYYWNKYKEELTDSYVKFTIVQHTKGQIKFADVPQELIDLKRKEIQLKRKIQSYA